MQNWLSWRLRPKVGANPYIGPQLLSPISPQNNNRHAMSGIIINSNNSSTIRTMMIILIILVIMTIATIVCSNKKKNKGIYLSGYMPSLIIPSLVLYHMKLFRKCKGTEVRKHERAGYCPLMSAVYCPCYFISFSFYLFTSLPLTCSQR